MTSTVRVLARLLALSSLALFTLGAQASFSILDSISTSVGSVSNSIRRSSDTSSGVFTAQGPYEVTEMVALDDQPDTLRLALRALQAGAEDIQLLLPRQAALNAQIAVGTVVEAQAREYGVAFATRAEGGTPRAFFLVLHDNWYRELESRRVTL